MQVRRTERKQQEGAKHFYSDANVEYLSKTMKAKSAEWNLKGIKIILFNAMSEFILWLLIFFLL